MSRPAGFSRIVPVLVMVGARSPAKAPRVIFLLFSFPGSSRLSQELSEEFAEELLHGCSGS